MKPADQKPFLEGLRIIQEGRAKIIDELDKVPIADKEKRDYWQGHLEALDGVLERMCKWSVFRALSSLS